MSSLQEGSGKSKESISTDAHSTINEENPCSITTSFNKIVSDEVESFLTTIPGVLQDITAAEKWQKIDLKEYSGDPLGLDYFMYFLPYFLEELEPDSYRRLCYLNQALKGKAKTLIQICFYGNFKDPYEHAKEILQKYFGQKHVIDKLRLNRAISDKRIKPDNLNLIQSLHVYVMGLKRLQNDRYSDKFNYSDIFLRIIRRLPRHLQEDWRKVADEIINIKHKEITLADIENFLNENRWRRSHKYYEASEIPENKDNLCQLCENVHKLHDCDAFQNMTQTQRMKYVTKKRLCLGCLTPNHSLNDCSNAVSCPIKNCRSKHNKLLHEYCV